MHNFSDWHFFNDASKLSPKGVLLHSRNQFASIILAYSTSKDEKWYKISIKL